jgi:tRNA threonylcarbamoyl adenosine modification protein (Sua5/YciO/YrdC/YwlC family)
VTENSRARSSRLENFSQAVAALRRGDVIVFPTETLYGLGADALDDASVERVFHLKGRAPDNPIPILVAGEEMLRRVVSEITPTARKLMRRFWPGPLTLVLPAQKTISLPLANRNGGVGVRMSRQPIAAQLVQELGHPLTATSANPSGEEPARNIMEAKSYFMGRVNVFLDGGPLTSKKGSTVVEVIGDLTKLIREGEISAAELEKFLKAEIL